MLRYHLAIVAPLGPRVASFSGSLPGDKAALGGAPICEGADTHTSIIETDIKHTL